MLFDFIKIIYWDGVVVKSSKCVIGIKGIGINVVCKCNCDVNDRKWCEDNSFFINKIYLFVKYLRFGDIDFDYEEGYDICIVRKLRCYGIV